MIRKLSILLASLGIVGCLAAFLIWAERRPADHYLSDLRNTISAPRRQPRRRATCC